MALQNGLADEGEVRPTEVGEVRPTEVGEVRPMTGAVTAVTAVTRKEL